MSLSRITASTAGGSLSPDSPSSVPDSRGGSGSLRSTENTAAASVGASTAPSSRASRQPRSSSQRVTTATTSALITTPTVARDKDAEILALRHQLSVVQRQLGPSRVRFTPADRALLAALLHRLPRDVLKRLHLVVCPDTVL